MSRKRWRGPCPDRAAVDRGGWVRCEDAILALADELKKGTSDAILRMSDLEVGLRYGKPRT
jgi:hypothetical protein